MDSQLDVLKLMRTTAKIRILENLLLTEPQKLWTKHHRYYWLEQDSQKEESDLELK